MTALTHFFPDSHLDPPEPPRRTRHSRRPEDPTRPRAGGLRRLLLQSCAECGHPRRHPGLRVCGPCAGEVPEVSVEQALELMAPPPPSPAEVCQAKEISAAVRATLDTLPAELSEVLLGRFFHDKTLEDLASGTSRQQVRQREGRALRQLRRGPDRNGRDNPLQPFDAACPPRLVELPTPSGPTWAYPKPTYRRWWR